MSDKQTKDKKNTPKDFEEVKQTKIEKKEKKEKKNTPKEGEESKSEKKEKKDTPKDGEEESTKEKREKKEKIERERAPKSGRVIIRNLGFDINQKHLQKLFGKFGEIVEINIPSSSTNEKLNRGFGFVEFSGKEDSEKAISELNNSSWKGRTITVNVSVPKASYEHRLDSKVEHTNMDRANAALPKVLRTEKLASQAEIDKKKKEEEAYKLKNAAKIKKQEKKKAKKNEIKKEEAKANESETLFVRNIGYETTNEKFKKFMEKFGAVKYAILVKSHNHTKDAEGNSESLPVNKGTGFVQFKNQESADQAIELSEKVESTMDDERRNDRLKNVRKSESLVSSLTLIKNEIELDGRRLIIKPSISKEKADNLKQEQALDIKQKKSEEDKRNLKMAKEGLLNEDNWIHQEPKLTKVQFEQRQKLFINKNSALKNSTNLFISKTRLQVRNLPRRAFDVSETKELMRVVADEWSKTLSKEQYAADYKGKKHITHVKIMKDGEKTDADTGASLGSGIAFVEFANEELALYAVQYLNNYELVPTKGLIVDFSMEDQRALFKRKEKIERWRTIAKENKAE